MIHLNAAKSAMPVDIQSMIKIDGNKIEFTVQDGPIGTAGVNGIQASDMLRFLRELFVSLNDSFPCNENDTTIGYIDAALLCQEARTFNRTMRGVEGKNLP